MLVGHSHLKIWGLTGEERLRRQLRALGIAQVSDDVATAGAQAAPVLLLHGEWVFDETLVQAMAKTEVGTLLVDEAANRIVAALVAPAQAAAVAALLGQMPEALPDACVAKSPSGVAGTYNHRLRKREIPYLGRLEATQIAEMERRTFGASYKGVTDLVTKYVWPWPARHVTALCARRGVAPNHVTFLGLIFTIIAFYQFKAGHYGFGLVAAWLMTFLDTVDGKLARVTLQSSTFGDIFDHGIDLIHPPFWWWAWFTGLGAVGLAGLPHLDWALWVILVGYVAQRIEEGIFKPLCGVGMHVWRPFDSFMRLITARRNPNLLILTLSALVGRPDIGFAIVAVWVLICFVIHAVVIVQGLLAKRHGPLKSWLAG
ncbi:CDP-alcohol phosphatidyltransferase family protein [Solimonas marina]|uniref:CDP-alcohol phosphatidyltransferase family protein n=1 Tax=Solimonas marina TaxID=2714601 RepID=UPI00344B0BD4